MTWSSLLVLRRGFHCFVIFFFSDTATTKTYTLSLHDALLISRLSVSATGIASKPPTGSSASSWMRRTSAPCGTQGRTASRSEEHTSELQSHSDLVCRLLLEKKKKKPPRPAARDNLSRTARTGP